MTTNRRIGVVGITGSWSSEALVTALQERTGYRLLIDMEKVSADLTTGAVFYDGLDLNNLDALIIKKIGSVYTPALIDRLEILRFLNERGLPVFSKPSSIIRLIDRLTCTITLRSNGIPMPETTITENIDEALCALNRYGRAVFKPLFTSKARGMMVISAGENAKEEIEKFQSAGNQVIYLQKMVEHPGADLGVAFMGGEYMATYSRCSAKDSWNTTIHDGGKYQHYEPGDEIITLASKAQAAFDVDFTCVDVVESPGGPLVFEVSAFGGFRGLLEANGIDAAGAYADYVLGRLDND